MPTQIKVSKEHVKGQAHQTPQRRFCTFFFEVLLFTDDASGKTSKKSVQKQRDGFWCVKILNAKLLALNICPNHGV